MFLSIDDEQEKPATRRSLSRRKITPLVMPRPTLSRTFDSEPIVEISENESDYDNSNVSTSEHPITPSPQLHIQKVIYVCVTTNILHFEFYI